MDKNPFFKKLHSQVLEIRIETYLWRAIFQPTIEAMFPIERNLLRISEMMGLDQHL